LPDHDQCKTAVLPEARPAAPRLPSAGVCLALSQVITGPPGRPRGQALATVAVLPFIQA